MKTAIKRTTTRASAIRASATRASATRASAIGLLLLPAILTCSLLQIPASWSAESSDQDVGTMCDIDDSKKLPKCGADQLKVLFEEPKDDDSIQKAWLLGLKGEKVIWKKPLTLAERVNVAKTDVVCRNGQIAVISQFPGCAAYTKQTFSWDGNMVKLVSRKQGDPSQEIVDKLAKIAKSGTQSELDNFSSQDNALFYPGNYITTKAISDMLAGGHKAALLVNQAHKPALAAQRLEICFDASAYLISLMNGDASKTSIPDRWIEQWTNESLEVPAETWAPVLNDYGFFLQEAGKNRQAVQVLNAVIKAQPNRAVAYLNVADALWASDHRAAAKMYGKYKELVAAQNLSVKIPDRVALRIASAAH